MAEALHGFFLLQQNSKFRNLTTVSYYFVIKNQNYLFIAISHQLLIFKLYINIKYNLIAKYQTIDGEKANERNKKLKTIKFANNNLICKHCYELL